MNHPLLHKIIHLLHQLRYFLLVVTMIYLALLHSFARALENNNDLPVISLLSIALESYQDSTESSKDEESNHTPTLPKLSLQSTPTSEEKTIPQIPEISLQSIPLEDLEEVDAKTTMDATDLLPINLGVAGQLYEIKTLLNNEKLSSPINTKVYEPEIIDVVTTENIHDAISDIIAQKSALSENANDSNDKIMETPDALNTLVFNSESSILSLSPALKVLQENKLGNYLIFTLFPHRKNEIIEEPVTKVSKDNTHNNELSIMKHVDKIDGSLSFSEEDYFGETGSAESYYDNQYTDYLEEDEGEIIAQAYPYPEEPEIDVKNDPMLPGFTDATLVNQVEMLLTTGDYYLLADDPIKARQYYIQSVKLTATEKSSPLHAKALVKLADLEDNPYLARFQYTNALDIYEIYPGYDLEIADILVKLVWTFDMTYERIVIYELLTRAKAILENHPYSPQYTNVLRSLAVFYETVNDFDRADANYKAALALDLQYLTTDDIRTILALENYAAFYLKFEEYEKAKEMLLFKLDAHEHAASPDYYNWGRTQSMLGWTYLQLKEYDESLHFYNAALGNINFSITKNRFMPHYYSLPAVFDLIYYFTSTNEHERAVPYFTVALALLQGENEEGILDYLRTANRTEIDTQRIVTYPWAADAEIDGLIEIMDYIETNHTQP